MCHWTFWSTDDYCSTLRCTPYSIMRLTKAAMSCRSTEKDVLRIIASQYLATLILGFANSATIQPVIAVERPVFYREKAAGAQAIVGHGQGGVTTCIFLTRCSTVVACTHADDALKDDHVIWRHALLMQRAQTVRHCFGLVQGCTRPCRTRWPRARSSCRTSSSSAYCTASSPTSSSTSSSAQVRGSCLLSSPHLRSLA